MRLFPKKFPNDEDGQVLKMLYKKGMDFNVPQNVDFFIAVPDNASGEKVLSAIRENGFNGELHFDEETGDWTCYCNINMLLNYEDIIAIQQQLDEIS